MPPRFLLILTTVFWLLCACLAQAIISPPDDLRQFRYVALDTGLTVLLVHDPSATKAAAAVGLPVGSLHDPMTHPGLAHFLEHMLFLGSAAYPEPGAFQAYVERFGGNTNAMTAYGSTIYVFEIDPPALAEGLLRLADTLAFPLLDPTFVDKERHAVHAEMESKKFEDGRRLAMLALSALHPAHPATRFTGGNLETLADKPGAPLHQALVQFHSTFYSAPLMKAAVLGPQDLDSLESLARDAFGRIPVRAHAVPAITAPVATPAEMGRWIDVRPVRPLQSLRIDFPLPLRFDDRRTKPLELVAAAIGAETPGSLVETLRQDGLALSLSAGVDTETLGNAALLSIHIQLTDKGAQQRLSVAAAVFRFLKTLAQAPDPWWEAFFHQQRQLAELHFRYDPPGRGFDLAAKLVGNMLRYPPDDVLFGPYRLDDLDAHQIQAILRVLIPEHARVFSVDPTAPTDQTAYFFGTPFAVRPLPPALRIPASPSNRLPELNPFVPTDLFLRPNEPQTRPEMVYAARGLRAWWMPSRFIHQPKVALWLRATAPLLGKSAKDASSAALLAEYWRHELAPLRFMAADAGLSLSLDAEAEGFTLQVEGFHHHAPELMVRTLALWTKPISAQGFAKAKAEQIRLLESERTRGVFGQATGQLQRALRLPNFSREERIAATRALTREQVERWRRQMLPSLAFQLLALGNLSRPEIQELAKTVIHVFGFRDTTPPQLVRLLPQAGTRLTIQRPVELEDSAAILAAFAPEPTSERRAASLVVADLVGARFYHQLRTEAQLGYIVSAFPLQVGHVAGIGFGIQSPVAGAQELTARIEEFLASLDVADLAPAFASVREGLSARLATPPQTLHEELGWLSRDLVLGQASWQGRQQLLEALDTLRWEDVASFWQEVVRGANGMHLTVAMSGTRHRDLLSPGALPDASHMPRFLPAAVLAPLWE